MRHALVLAFAGHAVLHFFGTRAAHAELDPRRMHPSPIADYCAFGFALKSLRNAAAAPPVAPIGRRRELEHGLLLLLLLLLMMLLLLWIRGSYRCCSGAELLVELGQ